MLTSVLTDVTQILFVCFICLVVRGTYPAVPERYVGVCVERGAVCAYVYVFVLVSDRELSCLLMWLKVNAYLGKLTWEKTMNHNCQLDHFLNLFQCRPT